MIHYGFIMACLIDNFLLGLRHFWIILIDVVYQEGYCDLSNRQL